MNPRLKALELHGYKTFASKYQFEFPGNITAVVGPNGSGKSNISDSLRWVLGEQSYGLLRGRKTEDMIFSGSDQRPRAGMASATITFDNQDGWLPIDFSEVSIARRAYRDGGNDYFLNGQKVRLKDISELLAQSGLAERTYTIIGQGLVDAALSLKPDERRRFFEEAAGIGLFRSRREESISRLESTQRNLERVEDILSELEPRLRSLERQARRAEEYDRVKADLNLLLKDWYGYHWYNSQKDLLRVREVLHVQEEKVKAARDNLAQMDQQVQEARGKLRETRTRLDEWHSQSSGLHSERERVSRTLAVLEERHRAQLDQIDNLEKELARLEEESKSQTERLAELEEEKQRLQEEMADAQKQVDEAQKILSERQKEKDEVDSQIRALRRETVNEETNLVRQKAHQQELENRLASLDVEQKNLIDSLASAENDFAAAQKDMSLAQGKLDDAENEYERLEEEFDAQNQTIGQLKAQITVQTQKQNQLEAENARIQAQLDVLIQAEKSLSGYASGAKSVLQAVEQGVLAGGYKILSNLINVPPELEVAIAAVLGENLDGILLDAAADPESALEYLENGEKGRTVLIPSGWAAQAKKLSAIRGDEVVGIAADLVKADSQIQPVIELLLGKTLVVRDRRSARKQIEAHPELTRVVTLKGEVFNATGLVVAGQDGRSSLVGRPRQRKELEEKLNETDLAIDEATAAVQKLEQKLHEAEDRQHQADAEMKVCRNQVSGFRSDMQQKSLQFEQVKQKQEWQKKQLATVTDGLNSVTDELKKLAAEITASQEKINQKNAQLKELTNLSYTKTTDEYQAQVVHWNTTLAVSARAVKDGERRYAEFMAVVNNNRSQRQSATSRLQNQKNSLVEIEAEKTQNAQAESELNEKIEALRVQIEPAEHVLQQLEAEYNRLQDTYTTLQQTQTTAERFYTQAQLEYTRNREALDNLRRRIEEDFGLVKLDYTEDVSGPTPLPLEGVGELPVLKQIPPELEDNINRQRALLRRMGAINPEAQKEYHEVKERFDYLTSQVADLKKADEDLRQVIAELDELMRREFKKTFTAVAAEFKQYFTRLFDGGSARLILTDEENPTETGIDIEAKLPGRREQGLSLLSGGERSLTAVALIFALLKVSPTPFCVLDEVDAALDEANVGRFTELLKELSSQTQFIVITHNRNTVQVADVIYGITMGRDSASQVVSLRLDEVSEDMAK
ncbi:MAG: chromosome segregation protein SMC [Anaerolineaceae bacterium]|nr:chromosome segregation protein SMC [Anaerolineaceae bacterium]